MRNEKENSVIIMNFSTGNNIGESGAIALSKALKANDGLFELNLGGEST